MFCLILQKKVGQSCGASRWRVCYQRGIPRLVLLEVHCAIKRPFPLAAIYPRSTRYCRLRTAGDQPEENFDAHPRRFAPPYAKLLQSLQEKDHNSAQQKKMCRLLHSLGHSKC